MNIERKIDALLIEIGTPCNLKGYNMIIEGVRLMLENPVKYGQITKELYPQIANAVNSTPSRTERAIRHAVTVTWDKYNDSLISILVILLIP